MPSKPLQFKPVPEGAVGARSTGPSTIQEVNAMQAAIPSDMPPTEKKPTVRRDPKPQRRTLGAEPPIDMTSWDVDPDRMAADMGLDF